MSASGRGGDARLALLGVAAFAAALAAAAALERGFPLAAASAALALLCAAARARACGDEFERSLVPLLAGAAVGYVLLEDTASVRLGYLQIGVLLIGLGSRRTWLAPACAAFLIALVLAAVAARELAGLPLPLAPSRRPFWIDVLLQIALATALIAAFTRRFEREFDNLARHGAELDSARAALALARGRLESRVQSRRADLERATRDLASFITSMSHDLKTPLRQMRGFIELQLEEGGAGAAHDKTLGELLAGTEQLAARVERILERERRA